MQFLAGHAAVFEEGKNEFGEQVKHTMIKFCRCFGLQVMQI